MLLMLLMLLMLTVGKMFEELLVLSLPCLGLQCAAVGGGAEGADGSPGNLLDLLGLGRGNPRASGCSRRTTEGTASLTSSLRLFQLQR